MHILLTQYIIKSLSSIDSLKKNYTSTIASYFNQASECDHHPK